jgi:diguanylate cyclase (GGDEF)-like protein
MIPETPRSPERLDELESFDGFHELAGNVLGYLRVLTDMPSWVIALVADGTWTVVASDDVTGRYPVGLRLPWKGTMCSRLVDERAPMIAPDVDAIRAYRTAEMRSIRPISAYVGVPFHDANGELLGTLCGFDITPQSDSLHMHAPTIALLASLLSTQLRTESKAMAEANRAQAALAISRGDILTGLVNRTGMDELLRREEARCRRYQCTATLILVKLNRPALEDHDDIEASLERTATLLASCCRATDIVGRIDDASFLLFLAEAGLEGASIVRQRIDHRLWAEHMQTDSVTMIVRPDNGTLHDVWHALEAGESQVLPEHVISGTG